MLAAISDNLEVLEFLYQNGADMNQADHMGNTPIYYSLYEDSSDCFRYLLDKSNLNHKNIQKETILFSAVDKGNEEAV